MRNRFSRFLKAPETLALACALGLLLLSIPGMALAASGGPCDASVTKNYGPNPPPDIVSCTPNGCTVTCNPGATVQGPWGGSYTTCSCPTQSNNIVCNAGKAADGSDPQCVFTEPCAPATPVCNKRVVWIGHDPDVVVVTCQCIP